MAEVRILCHDCHEEITPEEPLLCGSEAEHGQMLCEECFHRQKEAQWHSRVTKEKLIELLNTADFYRWQTFYISFIGGEKEYIAAYGCYPSVFSVLVSRAELVTLISEKDS